MAEFDWTRLSDRLDALFELEADERNRQLAAIATEDPALARQLRRLLAADAASGLLDGAVADMVPSVLEALAAADPEATVAAREPLLAGRQLGHYRLVERIGRGGMGEVWRGERIDGFEQVVAVKLIRPLMDSPDLRQRFARERRILARLEHPNIARLLDGGVAADGTPWFAMEFVRGESLLAYAEREQLDARGRVALLLQVCDAVAHAQAHLVVHRDLKPSNLLVDASGRVRVLDFGIARLLDDSAEARLTGTGVRVYTAAYAAPEQIRGEAVGTAADVFSLGAVLFELLTGAPPYPKRSAAPERLLATLATETAPRPSEALRRKSRAEVESLRQDRLRELDGDLDLIVATALHPDPARRYAGAAQFGEDLRRWLDGHPIAARADSRGYRLRRFVARHRLAVASAGAVLLALLGGLGVALWQMDVAREEARRADAQAQRVERTYRFVMSAFSAIQPTRGGGETPQQTVEMLLRDGLARLDGELADLPEVRAGLRATWAGSLLSLGYLDEGLPELERAVAEFSSLSPALDGDLASALINLASAYKDRARVQDADAAARRALTLLAQVPGDHRAERIQARIVLANLATTQFHADEAIALHEQILEDRRQLPGVRPVDLAVNYNNLASAYLYADRYAEAERRYRELDQLLRDDPQAPPSRRAYSLAGIAWALLGQGRYDEALAVNVQMEAIGLATLSREHDLVVNGQTLRARAALAQGDYARADALFADALPRANGTTASIARMHWGIGLLQQGRLAEARARLQAALDELAASGRGDAPPGLLSKALLATIRAEADPAATAEAEAALARFASLGLQRTDEYVRAALALSDLLSRQQQPARAVALRQAAAAVALPLLGAGHPLTREAQGAADHR